eukprot:12623617-Alexandrium_andersonii.AAC.1
MPHLLGTRRQAARDCVREAREDATRCPAAGPCRARRVRVAQPDAELARRRGPVRSAAGCRRGGEAVS